MTHSTVFPVLGQKILGLRLKMNKRNYGLGHLCAANYFSYIFLYKTASAQSLPIAFRSSKADRIF